MNKMQENFDLLSTRVLDALEKTNLEETRNILNSIKTPTIVTGVGGSRVVAVFTSKVLAAKNGIISICLEPRDMLYTPVSGYDNVLSCSYSGTNFGVQTSFQNELNKYLLSSTRVPNITNMTYDTSIPKEHSFISLAATIIPMTIMLDYYLEGNEIVPELLNQDTPIIESHPVFEIMSGIETSTAHTYLESTMVEAGLSIPIVHDKYSYCHGRSTMSHHNDHSLIMFNSGNELDKLLLEILGEYYKNIIRIDGKYDDSVLDDFYYTYQAMLLSYDMACSSDKDLSRVNYSPATKVLYKYKGQM